MTFFVGVVIPPEQSALAPAVILDLLDGLRAGAGQPLGVAGAVLATLKVDVDVVIESPAWVDNQLVVSGKVQNLPAHGIGLALLDVTRLLLGQLLPLLPRRARQAPPLL